MAATISGSGTSTLIDLTTSGNTTLGDATTDTLTVGVTGIVKDASGNVGIGTSSPAYKLDVSATSFIAASVSTSYSGAGNIRIADASTTSGSAPYIGSVGNNLAFGRLGTAEYMRIDSSGNLLVGTTSNSLSTKVFVSGSIGAQQTYGPMFVSNENNTDNVGRSSFNFQRGGSTVGQITTTNSTCAYTSVSDYRLKENIAPMIGALGKVAQLKPCTFTWKSNSFIGQGFIAHELQEVIPDCVTGEKDAVNEDGSIKPQGIDTSFLVATLTAAIQEQQALIQQLQADVAALKGTP